MKKNLIFIVPSIILLIITAGIQYFTFLNGDVCYHIILADKLFSGGKYVNDFLETNPPMVLYLYFPVIFLLKLHHFDINLLAKTYVFFLIILSIYICYRLIEKIVNKEDQYIKYTFYFSIVLALLLAPGGSFGEREHLFLILFFPYILSSILRAENIELNFWLACFIGLLAGLGIALKPFFLPPLVLIEIYLMIHKRNIFSWLRPETCICLVILIFYLGTVIVLQPNYFHIIMPLTMKYYFSGNKNTWGILFSQNSTIVCLILMACSGFIWLTQYYRRVFHILILTFIGGILAFLIPRSNWYYHVLPALGIGVVLSSLYLCQVLTNQKNRVSPFNSILFCLVFLILFKSLFTIGDSNLTALIDKKENGFNQLINYVNASPNPHSLYFFQLSTKHLPIIFLTHSQFAGRFPMLWWLTGVYLIEHNPKNKFYSFVQNDKNYLINALAEDLNRYQATFVIIDSDFLPNTKNDFNLIAYLATNKNFQQAWSHYRFDKKLGHLAVFKRDDSTHLRKWGSF